MEAPKAQEGPAPAATAAVPEQSPWHSKPAWKLPGWAEPVIVVVILFGAMYFTRRRGFGVFDRRKKSRDSQVERGGYRSPAEDEADIDSTYNSADSLLRYSEGDDAGGGGRHPDKQRSCCGVVLHTPNTSRFRRNAHSRVLQKFPFLIEMFYWVINYAFYRMTAVLSQRLFAETGIWEASQRHGIQVLEAEQSAPVLHWFFPVREQAVQRWFMDGHQDLLTVLNRCYALIHIPGTVGFIAWFYCVAPSFATFAVVRRTMTLTNFMAFLTFIFYPCMPPRLLPAGYGFLDTVRHDDAESVWMSGKYVNSLAAMPSMHFGYAFAIGCTVAYHSGLLRRHLEPGEQRRPRWLALMWLAFAFAYPCLILVTIVATANHYFLDAAVATCYALVAYACNEVFYAFIPLEDWLLWALRVDKPTPTTGRRGRRRKDEK